jgi:hypothetical protein
MVQVYVFSLHVFFSICGLDRVLADDPTKSAALLHACQKLRTLNPPPLLGLPGSTQFINDTALSALNAQQNSLELVSIVCALSYYHIFFLNHFIPVQKKINETRSPWAVNYSSHFTGSRADRLNRQKATAIITTKGSHPQPEFKLRLRR